MDAYDRLVADFHRHFCSDPNRRLQLGILERLGDLPDPSLEQARADAARAAELSQRFAELDAATLDADRAIDVELARLRLDMQVHRQAYRFNGRSELEQKPMAAERLGEGLVMLLLNDPRPPGERLADITDRLLALPDYLDTTLARLSCPVRRWVEIERQSISDLPELFASAQTFAEEQGYADSARLRSAADAAREALQRYVAGLAALPTTDAFHIGAAAAQKLVALRGIPLSLDEIHAEARAFLAQNDALLAELAPQLRERYGLAADTGYHALFEHVERACAVHDADDDALVARYVAEDQRIHAFIAERGLFDVPAGSRIRVVATPRFMRSTVTAAFVVPPPPFRDDSLTSVVYVTPSSRHSSTFTASLMMHEGVPGHHLQLAWAARHPSWIRRHFEAIDQAEGWTTMLETYMVDAGYMGEQTLEARYSGTWQLRRVAARAAIDLYFMSGERRFLDLGDGAASLAGDDPFALAGTLLARLTGYSAGQVAGELAWYSQDRSYALCFVVGNRGMWQLKREMQRALGKSGLELDRAFHRAVLQAGNLPVSLLRQTLAR